jgi:hypothetical protein
MAFMNRRGSILAALVLLVPALAGYAAGYEALLPLLVDLPGWQAEEANGADSTFEGVRAVTAYRMYESGDRRWEANILIGTQASMTWMPDYKDGFKMETPEGVMEVKKINGFLVFYMFEAGDSSGGIAVLLQDPSGDSGGGAVFAVSFEGLSLDEALKTVQRFNWAAMKSQVGRLK